MTSKIPSEGESLPLPVVERIDRVCLEFEAAWQRGHVPQVEDYLGELNRQHAECADEAPLHSRLALVAGIEQYRACARWARKALKEF